MASKKEWLLKAFLASLVAQCRGVIYSQGGTTYHTLEAPCSYLYMEVPLNLPIQGGSTYLYMEVPLTYKISTTYLFREVPLTYTLRHHLPIQGGTTYVPIQGGPTFLQGGITL